MTFSSKKAQEIYEQIKVRGKINYSIGLAENKYMTESDQHQPGPKWNVRYQRYLSGSLKCNITLDCLSR